MSRSRIHSQMIRVISSPSISTTGVFTLILAMRALQRMRPADGRAGEGLAKRLAAGGRAINRDTLARTS